MEPSRKDTFKSIYKSSIRASYFNHFQENDLTKKSKMQISKIQQEEVDQVDENTFRIMAGFVKPDDSYAVYQKSGRFHIEVEGFFSCLVSRKRYQVQLKNFKLKVIGPSSSSQFFNFDTESVAVVQKNDHFILEVDSCKKQFYLQPVEHSKRSEIVDDWVKLINKVIQSSEGSKNKYNYLPSKMPDFYTQQHISNEQFQKSANSLDIVLFKSQHSAAKIQRIFTNSQYDHVGVVLRNRKNQLFVFESASDDGVGLTPWKDMIKYEWYKYTDKIAWKRLAIVLTPRDIEIIQGYVAKTLGKQFEINLQKLFTFTSKLDRPVGEQEKKTYFCSELVARLYKQLGFLNEQTASSQYYPVDFSDKGKLKFRRQNVSLQPQRIISFNKKR